MAKNCSQLWAGMSADAGAQASAKTQKMLEEWPCTIIKVMGADAEREFLCNPNQGDSPAFGLRSGENSDDGLEYQEKLRSEWDARS